MIPTREVDSLVIERLLTDQKITWAVGFFVVYFCIIYFIIFTHIIRWLIRWLRTRLQSERHLPKDADLDGSMRVMQIFFCCGVDSFQLFTYRISVYPSCWIVAFCNLIVHVFIQHRYMFIQHVSMFMQYAIDW